MPNPSTLELESQEEQETETPPTKEMPDVEAHKESESR